MEGNMDSGDFVQIRNYRCDACLRRSVGGLFHVRGTPVLFLCVKCNPSVIGHFAQALLDAIFGGAS